MTSAHAFSHPAGLHIDFDGHGTVTLCLSRPERRHALSDELIEALAEIIETLPESTRIVVLASTGPVFCAGADLAWMKCVATQQEPPRDVALLDRLFGAIEDAPQIFVALVQGKAIGGGAGLALACDFVLASDVASFAFAECRLGLVAATILPFVMRRFGPCNTKAALLLGEPIAATRAFALGFIDELCASDELFQARDRLIAKLLLGGPRAQAATKALMRQFEHTSRAEQRALSRQFIFEARQSDEGQKGIAAFFAREAPPWARR